MVSRPPMPMVSPKVPMAMAMAERSRPLPLVSWALRRPQMPAGMAMAAVSERVRGTARAASRAMLAAMQRDG